MLEAMQQYEAAKTTSGRPSALSLEEQILLSLTYWREYQTLYHISMDFGIHESSVSRIIRKVEDVLIDSGKFELPKKLPSRVDDDINWSVVIVDATVDNAFYFYFKHNILLLRSKLKLFSLRTFKT